MRNKIVIYSDRESFTSTSSLEGELKRLFNTHAFEIACVDRHQFAALSEIKDDTFLFVLPGINGEKCMYPDHIGQDGFSKIRDFVENGGAYLGFCAGAYHAFSEIDYTPPFGRPKHRSKDKALIEGTATGPIHHAYIPDNGLNNYSGCTTISVHVEDTTPYDMLACYGNGPVLLPSSQDSLHTRVIARYNDVEGNPPAILERRVGQGLVIASGIVPQYGAMHIAEESYGEMGKRGYGALVELEKSLKPHEDNRLRLMGMLRASLLDHWNALHPEEAKLQEAHREKMPTQSHPALPHNSSAARPL